MVGENGAGKSTLMKILYGLYQPDAGSIAVRGRPVTARGPAPRDRTWHRDGSPALHAIPRFTVAENVILGSEPARAGPARARDGA